DFHNRRHAAAGAERNRRATSVRGCRRPFLRLVILGGAARWLPYTCEDPRALKGVRRGSLSRSLSSRSAQSRAKSWTLNSVADAKRSATRTFRVASCSLHTLPVS